MTKAEFIVELRKRLSGLPMLSVEEQIDFYVEIIEDKIEDGTPEEKAVSEIGSVEYIAEQIIEETPFTKIAFEKIKPKNKHKGLKTVLLILGSPIWVSLAVTFLAVVISLWAVGVSIIVSLWAVDISLWASAFAGAVGTVVFFIQGYTSSALALLGGTLVCFGVSILWIFVCKLVSKGLIKISKKTFTALKRGFNR